MTTQPQTRSLQATLEDMAHDLGVLSDCMDSALAAESVDTLQAALAETKKHLADLVVFLAWSVADSYTGTHHILPSTRPDDHNEVV